MDDPKRARSRKRLIRPRVSLQNVAPVLYSTPNRPQCPDSSLERPKNSLTVPIFQPFAAKCFFFCLRIFVILQSFFT